MIVVGVTGPIGSGKDTVSDYLKEEYGFIVFTMGDVVRELAESEGLEPTRENLGALSEKYRAKKGNDFISKVTTDKIRETDSERFVANGVRTSEDYRTFTEEFGEKFIMLLVDAKPKIRFKCLKKRDRPGDPETFEKFEKQESEELAEFDMKKIFRKADYTVHNNGTFEDLYKRVDRFAEEFNL